MKKAILILVLVSVAFCAIPGGLADTVSGAYSFAFGNHVVVASDYTAAFFSAANPGSLIVGGDIRASGMNAPIINIADSLILPLWSNHSTDGTVGLMGLDTLGTDTLWIYTQAGWLSIAND